MNYFKGWYFKCENGADTVALIPAYHRSGSKESASVQIITDDEAFFLPYKGLQKRGGIISVGKSLFSSNALKLSINENGVNAAGALRFGPHTQLRYDIMGPFKYLPFMQCRHKVYSMYHRVDGKLRINGKQYIFNNGSGYIEGDSGRSFPNKYLWTQCLTPRCSLMLAVAEIPIGPFGFTGVIGAITAKGKEYRIGTYLGAKVKKLSDGEAVIEQGDILLYTRLIKKNSSPLFAPCQGAMNKIIHESAACTAEYRLYFQRRPVFNFISERASFEFEY